MNREGYDGANFFIGTEVEHSPAIGKITFFVIGLHSADEILNKITVSELELTRRPGKKLIEHIYLGANQSFDAADFPSWEATAIKLLDAGFLVTLDFDVTHAEMIAHSHLTKYNNFIPMISVKLPSIQLLGYNATLKLDDKDFAATNPGVWCHSIHNLRDRSVFTDWSQYTKDTRIE
ncbi:MAG TPA: hypothetical protein VFM18_18645 [Methanosarcina sp.]|nr:hypothetical protein [Methanosarcina sp.]